LTGLIGYLIYNKDGLPSRDNDRNSFASQFENSYPGWKYLRENNLANEWRNECSYFNNRKYLQDGTIEGGVVNSKPIEKLDPSCYKRNPKFNNSILIWGDSHAQSLSPGLINLMPINWQVLQVASSACRPNPDIRFPSSVSQCDQTNYFAMKTIIDIVPDVVIIAQAEDHSLTMMKSISNRLKSIGVGRIIFLGPLPQWENSLPNIFSRQLWLNKNQRSFIGLNKKIIELNNLLLSQVGKESIEYVDLINFFCNDSGCLTYLSDDFRESMITFDYGHLTPYSSKFLAKYFLVNLITGN
jgi:hypothetical protein